MTGSPARRTGPATPTKPTWTPATTTTRSFPPVFEPGEPNAELASDPDEGAQVSQGGGAASDPETSGGGADAVPSTPDVLKDGGGA